MLKKIRYNIYRMKWELAKYKVPKYPIHVDFELSSICNLTCSFCPHSEDKQEFNKVFMDFNLFKDIIDEIQGKVKSIKFNLRGESTLHPQFADFLEYASGKFIDTRINTNGQYLEKYINRLMVKHCTNISISVDAFTDKTYEEKRGCTPDILFMNIEETIRVAKKYRHKPIITLSYVYTKNEDTEIEFFKRRWLGHNYKNLRFLIRPAMQRTEGKVFRNKEEAVGRKNCYMPNRRLVVTADGQVSCCCLLWHDALYLGDAKDGILRYWNCFQVFILRDALKSNDKYLFPKMCKNCESAEAYIWE